jgi:hypothetical protein
VSKVDEMVDIHLDLHLGYSSQQWLFPSVEIPLHLISSFAYWGNDTWISLSPNKSCRTDL